MYHSGRGWLMSPPPLLAHQRSQQVCTILCCPVAVQIKENTLWFKKNIDVKISKWTSIPRSIASTIVGMKAVTLFFSCRFLLWSAEKFPWLDFLGLQRFLCLRILLLYCRGNFRCAWRNDQSCLLRWSLLSLQDEPHSFSLSATIWISQFRVWPL